MRRPRRHSCRLAARARRHRGIRGGAAGSGRRTRGWRSSAGGRREERRRDLPRCSTSTGQKYPSVHAHQRHRGRGGRLQREGGARHAHAGRQPPGFLPGPRRSRAHRLLGASRARWSRSRSSSRTTAGWTDFPKGLIDIISYKGEIYSVPVNIHRSNVLWYNKTIFAAAHLQPPWSLDELLRSASALARKGITPLALGDNGIWASVHLLESVLLGTMGPDRYRGLWTGGHAVGRRGGEVGPDDVRGAHALREYRPRGAELGRRGAVRDRREMRHDHHGGLGGGLFQGKRSHPQRGLRLDRLSRHARGVHHALRFLRPAPGRAGQGCRGALAHRLRLARGAGRLQSQEGIDPFPHRRQQGPVRRLPEIGDGFLQDRHHRPQRDARRGGLGGLAGDDPGHDGDLRVRPERRQGGRGPGPAADRYTRQPGPVLNGQFPAAGTPVPQHPTRRHRWRHHDDRR